MSVCIRTNLSSSGWRAAVGRYCPEDVVLWPPNSYANFIHHNSAYLSLQIFATRPHILNSWGVPVIPVLQFQMRRCGLLYSLEVDWESMIFCCASFLTACVATIDSSQWKQLYLFQCRKADRNLVMRSSYYHCHDWWPFKSSLVCAHSHDNHDCCLPLSHWQIFDKLFGFSTTRVFFDMAWTAAEKRRARATGRLCPSCKIVATAQKWVVCLT